MASTLNELSDILDLVEKRLEKAKLHSSSCISFSPELQFYEGRIAAYEDIRFLVNYLISKKNKDLLTLNRFVGPMTRSKPLP